MDATSEALSEIETGKVPVDLESIFRVKYAHIARVIARIVRDRARAEELAVEVFLKLWRTATGPRRQSSRLAVQNGDKDRAR